MKKYIIIGLFQLFCGVSQAQLIGNAIEVLGKDSLKFYLKSGMLIEKECAEIYRVAKMHPKYFVYDGYVKDFYISGEIAVEGYLQANFFHGKYKSYYKNGKLKEEGTFEDGYKVGEWKYWYENGQLKKVFEFKKNEIFVKEFYTLRGKKTVVDGNGKMEEFDEYSQITIKGNITNGTLDEKWNIYDSNKNFLAVERYKNGKFLKGNGKSPLAWQNGDEYTNDAYIRLDRLPPTLIPYLPTQLNTCTESKSTKASTRSNMGQIDFILENLEIESSLEGYFIIGFAIGENGKATETTYLSTIKNKDDEKKIIDLIENKIYWRPFFMNGKRIKTYEVIGLQFLEKKYRILNDISSGLGVEQSARYRKGLKNLEKLIFDKVKLPAYFWNQGFRVSATIDFWISTNSKVLIDNKLSGKSIISDKEVFYSAIIEILSKTDSWIPASFKGQDVTQVFKGVFIIEDGVGKMKLFSSNWVLDE